MAVGPTFAVPPAGVSPFSALFSNGAIPAAAPKNWLADKIDPTNGELLSITEGLDPVDAAVMFQFQTVFGSGSALGSGGHKFRRIRKATERSQKAIEYEARRIFEPFVRRGWVELRQGDGVLVDIEGDTGQLVVNYFNRHARARRTVTIQLGGLFQ